MCPAPGVAVAFTTFTGGTGTNPACFTVTVKLFGSTGSLLVNVIVPSRGCSTTAVLGSMMKLSEASRNAPLVSGEVAGLIHV